MEWWNNGTMERKNINRGFKQLRVGNNAVDLHILTLKILISFPFELKKTVSNCINSSHSINPLNHYSNIPFFYKTINFPDKP